MHCLQDLFILNGSAGSLLSIAIACPLLMEQEYESCPVIAESMLTNYHHRSWSLLEAHNSMTFSIKEDRLGIADVKVKRRTSEGLKSCSLH